MSDRLLRIHCGRREMVNVSMIAARIWRKLTPDERANTRRQEVTRIVMRAAMLHSQTIRW